MSYTKKEIIEEAFTEIGLANYNFDLQSEQMQSALKRLDSMMATWNSKGIRIGYPLVDAPSNSNLNDDTDLRASAIEAVYLNLAVRLAPMLGKQLSMDTKKNANSAYKDLLRETSETIEMDYNTLPRGAGQKPWRYENSVFLPKKQQKLQAGNDSEIDFT